MLEGVVDVGLAPALSVAQFAADHTLGEPPASPPVQYKLACPMLSCTDPEVIVHV
jgi:hypothetical protein